MHTHLPCAFHLRVFCTTKDLYHAPPTFRSNSPTQFAGRTWEGVVSQLLGQQALQQHPQAVRATCPGGAGRQKDQLGSSLFLPPHMFFCCVRIPARNYVHHLLFPVTHYTHITHTKHEHMVRVPVVDGLAVTPAFSTLVHTFLHCCNMPVATNPLTTQSRNKNAFCVRVPFRSPHQVGRGVTAVVCRPGGLSLA